VRAELLNRYEMFWQFYFYTKISNKKRTQTS